MVSPPDTNCTSRHSTPASASAACAATTPYSTKLRPHLPHGCMPTPRIAMSRSALIAARSLRCGGRPLPHDVLVVVVFVERAEHELHVHADLELRRRRRRWRAGRARPSARPRARPRTPCRARTDRARRTARAARSGSSSTTTACPGATAATGSRSSPGRLGFADTASAVGQKYEPGLDAAARRELRARPRPS